MASPNGYDDKYDLQPFQKYRLEGGQPGNPSGRLILSDPRPRQLS